jgi:hypothetical protein
MIDFEKLSNDKDLGVREAVAKNFFCPPIILEKSRFFDKNRWQKYTGEKIIPLLMFLFVIGLILIFIKWLLFS